ncbi:MAG: MupG family TIM beta-alpha barrel fold protein [Micropruina sp.]|uniref:MupG family TIM beta-alpha barrel fold protein n=1 Tax=Micropruina sp. TaxID=2737536 RepID=UPI0039E53E70
MLYSLYPTDEPALRAAVADAALRDGDAPLVFTSLHIPESVGLRAFGAELAGLHRDRGIRFCADVSPGTLDLLGVRIGELGLLRDWGVTMVRIDYGFDPEQVRAIADAGGFRVAVNASTVSADVLDALDGLRPAGWHNFYPRPETGLAEEFFAAQNALLLERGLELFTFIPGERSFRAPLNRGLPTVESHRHANAYLNHARVLALCPQTRVVCAEGTLLPRHQEWIRRREQDGEVVLPLTGLHPAVGYLLDESWRLRPEGSAISHRIEGTRGRPTPSDAVNADRRQRGSLQADLAGTGRYAGELHLIRRDAPLSPDQARVGEVAAPYRGVVETLRPGDRVRFVAA